MGMQHRTGIRKHLIQHRVQQCFCRRFAAALDRLAIQVHYHYVAGGELALMAPGYGDGHVIVVDTGRIVTAGGGGPAPVVQKTPGIHNGLGGNSISGNIKHRCSPGWYRPCRAQIGRYYRAAAGYGKPLCQALSGSRRWRFPVRANSALPRAGMTGGTPGSPTPVGASLLSTISTTTSGT